MKYICIYAVHIQPGYILFCCCEDLQAVFVLLLMCFNKNFCQTTHQSIRYRSGVRLLVWKWLKSRGRFSSKKTSKAAKYFNIWRRERVEGGGGEITTAALQNKQQCAWKALCTSSWSTLKKAIWQGLLSRLAKVMKASASSRLRISTAAMKDMPWTWNTAFECFVKIKPAAADISDLRGNQQATSVIMMIWTTPG